MLKDMNEGTVEQILKRASVRLTRDLKAELPDAGIERVVVERNGAEGPHVRVVGVPETAPEHAAVVARAKALWDEPGQPLTQIRM